MQSWGKLFFVDGEKKNRLTASRKFVGRTNVKTGENGARQTRCQESGLCVYVVAMLARLWRQDALRFRDAPAVGVQRNGKRERSVSHRKKGKEGADSRQLSPPSHSAPAASHQPPPRPKLTGRKVGGWVGKKSVRSVCLAASSGDDAPAEPPSGPARRILDTRINK